MHKFFRCFTQSSKPFTLYLSYVILQVFFILFAVSFILKTPMNLKKQSKKEILREQYVFMARRLWNIITVPAGIIMLTTGITMIMLNLGLMKTPWFHLKLTFLVGLGIYHYWCWKKLNEIKNLHGTNLSTPNLKLRQANEIATFIVFLVVFTVLLKSMAIDYWWQLIAGFFVLVALIMATVKLVNKKK